jgi:hypothetical protein
VHPWCMTLKRNVSWCDTVYLVFLISILVTGKLNIMVYQDVVPCSLVGQ